MVISNERRQMFTDLYRMAEYYEYPFQPGDVDGNAAWFIQAQNEKLIPFITKYPNSRLAYDLAMAVVDDANERAKLANMQNSVV